MNLRIMSHFLNTTVQFRTRMKNGEIRAPPDEAQRGTNGRYDFEFLNEQLIILRLFINKLKTPVS